MKIFRSIPLRKCASPNAAAIEASFRRKGNANRNDLEDDDDLRLTTSRRQPGNRGWIIDTRSS